MPLCSHHPPPAVELTKVLCTLHYPSSDSPPPAAPLRAALEVPEGTPEVPFWSSPHSSRMCYTQTWSEQCTHVGNIPSPKGSLLVNTNTPTGPFIMGQKLGIGCHECINVNSQFQHELQPPTLCLGQRPMRYPAYRISYGLKLNPQPVQLSLDFHHNVTYLHRFLMQ